uniref:PH domain-containing protein n=1 Tax=Ornithorhynchus anatinus TaxID=9258 RepID=A0A6I8P293_ORNAN
MQGGPFGPDPAPSAPTAFWDLESVRLRPPARASGPQPRKGRGPPGAPGPSSPSSSSSCWDLIMKYRVVSKPRPAAFLRPPEGAPGPGGDGGRPGDAGGAECAGVDRIPSPALGGTEAGSVLRRWKRNWFVLWLDGTLGYSRDEAGQDEEGRVLIRFNCRSVKSGHECPDLQPPEGLSRSCLLTVHLRVGPRLVLCADSEDDAVCTTPTMTATSRCPWTPTTSPSSAPATTAPTRGRAPRWWCCGIVTPTATGPPPRWPWGCWRARPRARRSAPSSGCPSGSRRTPPPPPTEPLPAFPPPSSRQGSATPPPESAGPAGKRPLRSQGRVRFGLAPGTRPPSPRDPLRKKARFPLGFLGDFIGGRNSVNIDVEQEQPAPPALGSPPLRRRALDRRRKRKRAGRNRGPREGTTLSFLGPSGIPVPLK